MGLQAWEPSLAEYCNQKWGLAARRPKGNKKARLVERKVCFILDAGNWGWGQWTPVQRPTPPPSPSCDTLGVRAFIGEGRGLHAERAQAALTVILKLVIGGLTSVILIVISTVNLQFQGWFVSISFFLNFWILFYLFFIQQVLISYLFYTY